MLVIARPKENTNRPHSRGETPLASARGRRLGGTHLLCEYQLTLTFRYYHRVAGGSASHVQTELPVQWQQGGSKIPTGLPAEVRGSFTEVVRLLLGVPVSSFEAESFSVPRW